MKERPILFSAPMVRALLNGSKTQTRRVVKPQPFQGGRPEHWSISEFSQFCHYGQSGDRLWVREAWRTVLAADHQPPRELHSGYRLWHEATRDHQPGFGKLRPSMFMPRWASRITLEITSVRVERLQDISEADAIAEGIPEDGTPCPRCNSSGWIMQGGDPMQCDAKGCGDGAVDEYCTLWESINGPGSWDVNPWVWVVEFKRTEGGAA